MAKEEIYQPMQKWEQSDEYSRSYAKKKPRNFHREIEEKIGLLPIATSS